MKNGKCVIDHVPGLNRDPALWSNREQWFLESDGPERTRTHGMSTPAVDTCGIIYGEDTTQIKSPSAFLTPLHRIDGPAFIKYMPGYGVNIPHSGRKIDSCMWCINGRKIDDNEIEEFLSESDIEWPFDEEDQLLFLMKFA